MGSKQTRPEGEAAATERVEMIPFFSHFPQINFP